MNTYTGDMSLLNREITQPDWSNIGNQVGKWDLPGGYEFQAGGNIYQSVDTGRGTRTFQNLGSLADRQAREAEQGRQAAEQQRRADIDRRIAEAKTAQEAQAKAAQDAIVRQKQEKDTQFAANRTQLQGFTDRYATAVPQVTSAAMDKYGVSDLLGFTNALNTRIKELQTNSSGGGAGGYASSSQVDKTLGRNYLPQYLSASENLQRGAALAQNEITNNLKPFESEKQLINEQIARETTGYDTNQQRELDVLLQKMRDTGSLSTTELNVANDLAARESNYQLEIEKINRQTALEEEKLRQPIAVGTNAQLYDPVTGKILVNNTAKTNGPIEVGKESRLYDPVTGKVLLGAASGTNSTEWY